MSFRPKLSALMTQELGTHFQHNNGSAVCMALMILGSAVIGKPFSRAVLREALQQDGNDPAVQAYLVAMEQLPASYSLTHTAIAPQTHALLTQLVATIGSLSTTAWMPLPVPSPLSESAMLPTLAPNDEALPFTDVGDDDDVMFSDASVGFPDDSDDPFFDEAAMSSTAFDSRTMPLHMPADSIPEQTVIRPRRPQRMRGFDRHDSPALASITSAHQNGAGSLAPVVETPPIAVPVATVPDRATPEPKAGRRKLGGLMKG